MGEREQSITGQPEHENGEQQRELEWLEENRPLFYAASAVAAEQIGRGALFVDTTTRLPHGGHPMSYQAEGEIEPDDALHTLLQEYDPHKEFVVTLLKSEGQASTHLGTAPEMEWWEAMETKTAISEQEPGERTEISKALFDMGQIVMTPGATAGLYLVERHPVQLLARHIVGDWGKLPEHDVRENEISLEQGYRLFSAYNIEDQRFYVITEWDRSVTTVLLPEEY